MVYKVSSSMFVTKAGALLLAALLALGLFAGCGDDPSDAEVRDIVQAEIQALESSQLDPAQQVTEADVRRMVEEALDRAIEPGLTAEQVRLIAQAAVADIPPRSSSADYTRFVVRNAIARYEVHGLKPTIRYYSDPDSVDGQWYVFIVDADGRVAAHPDAHLVGLSVNGWVGKDARGYDFGVNLLAANADGRWVSYLYRNPEAGGVGAEHSGALEYKHVWAVRHDGLVFASGWHASADQYTRFVVEEAIDRYHTDGLQATLEHYSDPASIDEQWYVFVATPEGELLGHYDPENMSEHLKEMVGDGSFAATPEGVWIEHDDFNPVTGQIEHKHYWLVLHDGLVWGSGWHHGAPGE